jgi:hypothetical protein
MRDDLLDTEVPDAVDRRLGEACEEFSVGGSLDGEGVAAVVERGDLVVQRDHAPCREDDPASDEER